MKKKKDLKKKMDKRYLIIVAAVIAVVIVACLIVNHIRVKNTDISLESLSKGGSDIYNADGELYMSLDIKKCGGWIKHDDIAEELFGISDAKNVSKSYAELIINQFKGDAKDKDILAAALESKYSEDELAEFFMNTVYLGNGVYGISAGSKYFFGCEYENLSERRMEAYKKIITNYIANGNYEGFDMEIYEHSMRYEESGYADGVIGEVAKKLMENGYDELSAYNEIYLGELDIYTYMDENVQSTLDKAYSEKSVFVSDTSDNSYIQSAMVIMDDAGRILAVASGNDGDKLFNRALSKTYQIGSTMKPISTYSLAIEKGIVNFSSTVKDEQMLIMNELGEYVYWPSNVDDEYGEDITVTEALQKSKNTIAVQIGSMLGEEEMFTFLKDGLGYDLVYNENNNSDLQLSALSLGYMYKGITLDKLAASYEMFSNGGQFADSALVKLVKDSDGNEILKDERIGQQVISENTAYIMNRLLYNNVYGEYAIAKDGAVEGVEVLGKTGTVAEGGNDISKFFVGVTSDYIASVWIGYDGEESLSLKVFNGPQKIYAAVMSRLEHTGDGFVQPSDVLEKEYCTLSGMLATDKCAKTGIGYYTEENMPNVCQMCQDNN